MAARAVRTSATDHFAIISGIEKIATDIYSFENLRKGGYVYVDKTDLLWRLASEKEGRQFFISRPRRFGKSLMLSTLKCLFEGRKDLFRGLKIEKRRWAWKTTYPVVMLDMSKAKASTPEALEAVLLGMVLRLARSFKVRLAKTDIVTAGSAFAAFLEGLADKQGGDMSSQAAIRQVREKRKADVYKGDKRPVTLVGVNFRTAKRNIDEPLFAKL